MLPKKINNFKELAAIIALMPEEIEINYSTSTLLSYENDSRYGSRKCVIFKYLNIRYVFSIETYEDELTKAKTAHLNGDKYTYRNTVNLHQLDIKGYESELTRSLVSKAEVGFVNSTFSFFNWDKPEVTDIETYFDTAFLQWEEKEKSNTRILITLHDNSYTALLCGIMELVATVHKNAVEETSVLSPFAYTKLNSSEGKLWLVNQLNNYITAFSEVLGYKANLTIKLTTDNVAVGIDEVDNYINTKNGGDRLNANGEFVIFDTFVDGCTVKIM